jgi:hypothetical protein
MKAIHHGGGAHGRGSYSLHYRWKVRERERERERGKEWIPTIPFKSIT